MMDPLGVDIDVELLISLVHERGVLWDKSLDDYKSRSLTLAAWREVCAELQEGFETLDTMQQHVIAKHVMKKWTNVKDCWLKGQKRDMEIIKSGARIKPGKKYIYQKQMSFLKKNIGLVHNDESCSTTEMEEEREEKPCAGLRGGKKRKLVATPWKLADDAAQTPEDRHLSFFRGILPSLKELSEDETLQFQLGVLNIVQNIRRARSAGAGTQ